MPLTGSRIAPVVRSVTVTALALGALSLTACTDGTGIRDEGAATLVARTTDQHSTVPLPCSNRRTAPHPVSPSR
ncbi:MULTISPECIES: hypothetical protein [unclassified Streptomyces]|uniref:hypothetical protein n=1 Tax=unclassified Streptomyces TaxID=2593676 RepID=UPI00136D5681|nr:MULTISPECIES: hypothetical protein [unclassified Streptomyces]NEA03498.1 hypothetical protein [Streptomyces sp. SID10116]MYY85873.1 hypothetical protein [Streptomyces sp. SID335]MYZ12240.1 hypothetical protein [Streptomyces sp. SID337]NDZ90100.1 hypothetical protein [Streptomyces sp. SID10115]NEB45800.1 hypothetical protein [Streptomyces sp. SID339]